MNTNKPFVILTLLGLSVVPFFYSCQDVIKVKLNAGTPTLAVDGWITDKVSPDTITLSLTAGYLDAAPAKKVSGAVLQLTGSDSSNETLSELLPTSGRYLIRQTRARVGVQYTLKIIEDGETFVATNRINRNSPSLDSISFKYHKSGFQYDSAGYYALVYGQEPAGLGDCVRFKVYRNKNLLNQPSDLTIYQDEYVDGTYFTNGLSLGQSKAFALGDTVTVESWSLNKDEYNFYNQLNLQIENRGLFQTTPYNVITNVINENPASAKATGYFGGSLVQTITGVVH